MISTPLTDAALVDHLDRIADDGMEVFVLADGSYRGALLHGTRLINQMRANHGLGILETLMLGHGYIGVGLLTSLVKGKDRIMLALECDGPVGGLSVDSSASGHIRGYLKEVPIAVDAPLESFDLSRFVGKGTIAVTRVLEGARAPVTGRTEIVYGNLGQDLANYFVVSEQTPTAISLSVYFDREGTVTGAGGLFLQAMPGAEATLHAELDAVVSEMPSLGETFAAGDTAAHLIINRFAEYSPQIIGTRGVDFACPCKKDRFREFLVSLPATELRDISENGPFPLKVTCHNCNSTYEFDRDEIDMINRARQNA